MNHNAANTCPNNGCTGASHPHLARQHRPKTVAVCRLTSGTGKSHLLIGLGLAACEQGRRVRYVTTAQLVNELVEAADERRLSRVVGRYGRLDLLCLDELGYVQIDPRGAELLFQIITEREERASIAIASNLPFSEWGTGHPRPTPGRRHRRPGHLQRPHHRDRHRSPTGSAPAEPAPARRAERCRRCHHSPPPAPELYGSPRTMRASRRDHYLAPATSDDTNAGPKTPSTPSAPSVDYDTAR